MTLDSKSLEALVKTRIDSLRPKLLDLGKRNPLIATKLGPRSNSHFRVVDELPDIIFFELINGRELTLVALPPLEADPKDEGTEKFRDALINARITDADYINTMEQIDRDAEDFTDKTLIAERALKDRVRATIGLPPRTHKQDLNISQHARANGIQPSYDLPMAKNSSEEDRHTHDLIQTLLLPSDLERKLNAITSKGRSWIQETGMNVMHIAFGFLEWADDTDTKTSFAPLILLQIEINKARTPQGPKFSLAAAGDEPTLNLVLAEKLRIENSIEIPAFTGGSIEEYFVRIAEILPKKKNWRVRRQIAIGVFPSARMAMYHDLDTTDIDVDSIEIVKSLLAGSDAGEAAPFADEYDIDQPEIEAKVPYLVSDADSSQFSALVDISDGKNVAIEGPPGTGKSQTIVNAIAAALNDGKKVLFVAEKLAALNVVKSRLEAVGLGEFLLPLQADKSTREQVIQSIKARLEMKDSRAIRDYDDHLEQFRKTRAQLAEYINTITAEFEHSGLTNHAILGKSIATSPNLVGIKSDVLDACKLSAKTLNNGGFTALAELGVRLEDAFKKAKEAKDYWRHSSLSSPDRFSVEDACAAAERASIEATKLADARDELNSLGIDAEVEEKTLRAAKTAIEQGREHFERHPRDFLLRLLGDGNSAALNSFLSRCRAHASVRDGLSKVLADEIADDALGKLRQIEEIASLFELTTVSDAEIAGKEADRQRSLEITANIAKALAPLVQIHREAAAWQLDDLAKAHAVYAKTTPDALELRNDSNRQEGVARSLRALSNEGRQLQLIRDNLSSSLSVSSPVSVEILTDSVAVLRQAGPFGFLSSSYRSAKKLFKSLSKSTTYSKPLAIGLLENLIDLKTESTSFLERASASGLFGVHFRGLDTRFDHFDELSEYLGRVRTIFRAPEQRSLRSFMLTASSEDLDLIPALPEVRHQITFSSLGARLDSLRSEVDQVQSNRRRLKDLSQALHRSDISIKEIGQTISLLEGWQIARSALDESGIAKEILGDDFAGHLTDVTRFEEAADWAEPIGAEVAKLVAKSLNYERAAFLNALEIALAAHRSFSESISKLSLAAKIDAEVLLEETDLRKLASDLQLASQDQDGLFAHASCKMIIKEAVDEGVGPLIQQRLAEKSFEKFGLQVEALAVRQLAKSVYSKFGTTLGKYTGQKLDELRAKLAEKDRELIKLSRQQLRAKIRSAARPPRGNGIGKKSSWTNMSLIENEISKKQRFIPVRDLTQRAGSALTELKPCWMMSPLAVAQYVPKERIKFDLCIIDEASQMPPESAIGALFRSDQAVVVGDTNQLPPSSFFKTVIDDEDDDEDDTVLNESILEMANGSFRPARRLRWHYRSRHSGLIRFSNSLVYDDSLIVFPSATESMSQMGIEFRSVKGLYKSSTNAIEAKEVVQAIVRFMETDPGRSLGVVTLNKKQMDLIREEFEYLTKDNRAVQRYIDDWKEKNDGLEEFFIKNLENVQGDERDVIFISTVYGPEQPGARVMQRFGPINGLAGKRRLNVLFTRAKQKIITFSSMTAADIEAEESGNVGAYMLKRWLEYSAAGILESGSSTERSPDSDFELFVIQQIRAMGCTPVPQVGVAGYFVDIGIRHPDWPHGFILGVECDGATYHSAKSARDRDRLRQEILEGLGWKLHRIWSTDWFNHPRQEAERLRVAIAERMKELKALEHKFTHKSHSVSEKIIAPIAPRPAGDLFDNIAVERSMPAPIKLNAPVPTAVDTSKTVEVGDTVRVKYLTGDKSTIQIMISQKTSDPSNGVVHFKAPIASALLGAEKGEEVEVLVGSYMRPAVVESIVKGSSKNSR
ncbi:MAG: DUF4011 domain-containing protein [Xanthobacteraceae bacterium]|nr:DUF4011 domain-containing protein [Xanthobacteraceae bacterium]